MSKIAENTNSTISEVEYFKQTYKAELKQDLQEILNSLLLQEQDNAPFNNNIDFNPNKTKSLSDTFGLTLFVAKTYDNIDNWAMKIKPGNRNFRGGNYASLSFIEAVLDQNQEVRDQSFFKPIKSRFDLGSEEVCDSLLNAI